jgi:1-acyl-sn-glycerol-3-phosphate acyltransferase
MYEIMRLSGQEYVDMYAAKAKEAAKERARELDREKAKQATAASASDDEPEKKAS